MLSHYIPSVQQVMYTHFNINSETYKDMRGKILTIYAMSVLSKRYKVLSTLGNVQEKREILNNRGRKVKKRKQRPISI